MPLAGFSITEQIFLEKNYRSTGSIIATMMTAQKG
jgi:hypothetical protein